MNLTAGDVGVTGGEHARRRVLAEANIWNEGKRLTLLGRNIKVERRKIRSGSSKVSSVLYFVV
jgi:hypothetical protein